MHRRLVFLWSPEMDGKKLHGTAAASITLRSERKRINVLVVLIKCYNGRKWSVCKEDEGYE